MRLNTFHNQDIEARYRKRSKFTSPRHRKTEIYKTTAGEREQRNSVDSVRNSEKCQVKKNCIELERERITQFVTVNKTTFFFTFLRKTKQCTK